jgi:hypothetical protein
MECSIKLIELPCHLSGIGYTAKVWSAGDTTLMLMHGHGISFPSPSAGQHFYVSVSSACNDCCARFKVSKRVGDVLTVALVGAASCTCMGANAKVAFLSVPREIVQDIVAEIGINVEPPLVYDCVTRTLSIDCRLLKQTCAVCP